MFPFSSIPGRLTIGAEQNLCSRKGKRQLLAADPFLANGLGQAGCLYAEMSLLGGGSFPGPLVLWLKAEARDGFPLQFATSGQLATGTEFFLTGIWKQSCSFSG